MATIEELLNNIGEYPVIRDFGTYANYKPESTHKDVLYVATDTKQILLNGEEYVGDFDELKKAIEDLNQAIENVKYSSYDKIHDITIGNNHNKVAIQSWTKSIPSGLPVYTTDYIEAVDHDFAGVMLPEDKIKLDSLDTTNKQLSTEDFTTALKEKLDGLTNYDDSELDEKIEALKSRLDTLVGSEDATAVIDTFKEIENFLQGITNTETLTGLLQEMKSEIVQLCANTYLPLSGGTITGTGDTPFNINTTNTTLNAIGQYYKINNVKKAWVGYTAKNNYGTVIYNSSSQKYMGIKDDGTPHYQGNTLYHSGNFNPDDYYKKPDIELPNGVEALNIINTTNVKAGMRFVYKPNDETENRLGFFGYDNRNGVTLYNQASNSRIGILDDGTFYYTVGSVVADDASTYNKVLLDGKTFRRNIEIKKGSAGGQSITTQDFIEILKNLGAFNYSHWEAKAKFKYAINDTITDTGCGNIHLSGAIIEVWSINSTDNYTIRVTTAPTTSTNSGGIINAVFIYRNQGGSYNPGWTRLANLDDIPKTVVFEDNIDFNIREYGEDFILTGGNNITAFNTIIANASKLENVNIKLKGNGIVKNITSCNITDNVLLLGITIVYDNGNYSKYALNAVLAMERVDNAQIHCVVLEGFIK